MLLQGPTSLPTTTSIGDAEKQDHHSFGIDTIPRRDCENGNSEPIDTEKSQSPLRNIWHESIYIFVVTAAQLTTVRIRLHLPI